MQARMLAGDAWSDVTIQNVSRRGLMAYSSQPPTRGEYVEIRAAQQIIVGRVAWSAAGMFGLRSQDDIDLDQLVGLKPASPYTGPERRRSPRPATIEPRRETPEQLLERSRRFASLVNFLAVALAGLIGAVVLFVAISHSLGESMRKASAALNVP